MHGNLKIFIELYMVWISTHTHTHTNTCCFKETMTRWRVTGVVLIAGNFCPVCQKCYTDDDWESQMIQCSTCHSWVHSRCEELTGKYNRYLQYRPVLAYYT